MVPFIKSALALTFVGIFVSACEAKPEVWTDEIFFKNYEIMQNMGTAFAVHDICMPLISDDEEALEHVKQEISSKRWAELLEFDTAYEYSKVIDLLRKQGATDEQIETLEEAYQIGYDDADETIQTVTQCEITLINYYNTILNSGVRN